MDFLQAVTRLRRGEIVRDQLNNLRGIKIVHFLVGFVLTQVLHQ